MSQPFVIVALLLWLLASEHASEDRVPVDSMGLWSMVLVVGVLLLVMRKWSRRVLQSDNGERFWVRSRRHAHAMLVARVLVLIAFGVAIFEFGAATLVNRQLDRFNEIGVRLPSLVLGTLPVFLALCGLWWSSFPIERHSRELHAQELLNNFLPVHMPPTLGRHLWLNARMQILFTAAPVMVGVFVTDMAGVIARGTGIDLTPAVSVAAFVLTVFAMLLISPWLLTRVLDTEPLPEGRLRERLEALSERLNVRCRDVLLWRTGYGMGNAVVIGLLPRMRYILLSDLLIETLSDSQIEAVFAHEAGHIRHRHVAWYVLLVVGLLLAIAGPAEWVRVRVVEWLFVSESVSALLTTIPTLGVFLILFGIVSRIFEHQADAFAARAGLAGEEPAPPSHVLLTPAGAEIFASALIRVAQINHLPLHHPPPAPTILSSLMQWQRHQITNFRHPCIAERLDHVRAVNHDKDFASRFERRIKRTHILILCTLMILSGFLLATTL
jgi:STE24 endopeptidase